MSQENDAAIGCSIGYANLWASGEIKTDLGVVCGKRLWFTAGMKQNTIQADVGTAQDSGNMWHVRFEPATLCWEQSLFVIAPSEAAARKFILRECPGCEVRGIERTNDRTQVYAESDAFGQRI